MEKNVTAVGGPFKSLSTSIPETWQGLGHVCVWSNYILATIKVCVAMYVLCSRSCVTTCVTKYTQNNESIVM